MTERQIGPHVVDGHLFFKMPDGSTILCECIGEPYASQIVEMWQYTDEPYIPTENTVRILMEDWRKINRCIDDTSYANDADFWHHMNDLIVRESSVE